MQLSSTIYNIQVQISSWCSTKMPITKAKPPNLHTSNSSQNRTTQTAAVRSSRQPSIKLSLSRLHTWEVDLGQAIGPFYSQPFQDLFCSPIGLVLKYGSNEIRMNTHSSFPRSINSFINLELAEPCYQSFDVIVTLVPKYGLFW